MEAQSTATPRSAFATAAARAPFATGDDRARRDAWQELAQGAAIARTWGDCYGYLLVATGRAEVMVDDVVSAWDAAALMPIIEEAGGVFTDWTGAPTAFGGDVIATNGGLATSVRDILMRDASPAGQPAR